jgi:hypothetical protein
LLLTVLFFLSHLQLPHFLLQDFLPLVQQQQNLFLLLQLLQLQQQHLDLEYLFGMQYYQLQKMKALIIGATGATGKDLLQKLIDDTHFSEIHVFGRRALELRNNNNLQLIQGQS